MNDDDHKKNFIMEHENEGDSLKKFRKMIKKIRLTLKTTPAIFIRLKPMY